MVSVCATLYVDFAMTEATIARQSMGIKSGRTMAKESNSTTQISSNRLDFLGTYRQSRNACIESSQYPCTRCALLHTCSSPRFWDGRSSPA